MNSYEIMLSESQERMLVIVKKGREQEIKDVFEKWDLHAAHIGEVKEGDRMVVRHKGVVVADLPAKSLTDEAPIYDQPASEPAHIAAARAWDINSVPSLSQTSVEGSLEKLLAHPTIASKRWVWQQYDHQVMSGCTVEPGSDAGVVHLSIAGIDKRLAISNDCNNRFCYLNPYQGAQIAFAECMRNLACSGARALAVTDNLNFANPNKPEAYHMLKECVKGLADACSFFDVPVVGGNVSLYNEHGDGAIDPTPVISMVGLIEKGERVTRSFISNSDQNIILVGGLPHELGGSYFLQTEFGKKEGTCPSVNLAEEKKVQDFLIKTIDFGHIRAAHDLSEGGLLVAIAEMLFENPELGADLSIDSLGESNRLDALLFGESQGRVLVSVSDEDLEEVMQSAVQDGLSILRLGKSTRSGRLKLLVAGNEILDSEVNKMHKIWSEAIPEKMNHS
jgi:phosphoribosylformylglycinamidine synthase